MRLKPALEHPFDGSMPGRNITASQKPLILVGGIGLENPAETREFRKNCRAVTPNATLLKQEGGQKREFPQRPSRSSDSGMAECDDTLDPAIRFIAERWNSTPVHICQAILILIDRYIAPSAFGR